MALCYFDISPSVSQNSGRMVQNHPPEIANQIEQTEEYIDLRQEFDWFALESF